MADHRAESLEVIVLPPSRRKGRQRLHRRHANGILFILAGEDEREGGALLYFHLRRPLDLAGAGPEFPSSLEYAAEAKRQPGAWIDAEKPFWWDVPAWVAAGQVDSEGQAIPAAWHGKSLFELLVDRTITPTQMQIAREILTSNNVDDPTTPANEADVDTAFYNDAFLAAESYGLASLLAFHARDAAVLGAEPRWVKFDLPPAASREPGLLVLSTRRREPPDPAYWTSAAEVGRLTRARGGVTAEEYRVYRVVPREDAALRALPRPGGD